MKPLYWCGYTLCKTIAKIGFRYRAFGQENIIEDGPAIMAANHQSYLDPPLVGITCRSELYFLARKTLFKNMLFGSILSGVNAFPVDLSGADLTAVRTVINLLKQGHRTVIFPEGTRSLTGEIQPARAGHRHDHCQNARSSCSDADFRILSSMAKRWEDQAMPGHRRGRQTDQVQERRFRYQEPRNLSKNQRAGAGDHRRD